MALQEHDILFLHWKGKANVVADVLSMNPVGAPEETLVPLEMFAGALIRSELGVKGIILQQRADSKLEKIIRVTEGQQEEDAALCQMRKKPSEQPFGLLQPIPIVEKPNAVLGIDLVGPLPCTADGNKYLLVCVDYATRWVVAKAVPEQETTGYNPFFLFYGRLPMLPVEATFPWPADAPEPYDEFLERVERARQSAASRTDKEKVTQSRLRWMVFPVHVSYLKPYIEGYYSGDTSTEDVSSSPYDEDASDDNVEESSVVEAYSGGNPVDQ
ncbi:hypothetical protein J437_LFUL012438 [Ladona fulva]|uniref:Integrase catalytic domain-containing protein n=1 Tax=Ladona fulva TaxID=123851 RepID=A0A8K0KJ37_LADFU|nr:hypothetical protein J437_LFUL012438 [Ladona fulva]